MSENVLLAKLHIQDTKKVILHETTLVSCSTTTSVLAIPDGITALADGCLSGQGILEKVILPESILKVGLAPFGNCGNLKLIICHNDLSHYENELKYANNAEVQYVHCNRKN